jgi:GNAT superfamily N-acetyltransferase
VHTDLVAVADLICRCYDVLKPSPETIARWCEHPVFREDLWIWIVEKSTGDPVGLGIAEFDSSVPEGSLEWIQVLPSYRGWGLGRAVVTALLDRLQDEASFTTVSGRVDNRTHPENLYRRCGFRGKDNWWVLAKPNV